METRNNSSIEVQIEAIPNVTLRQEIKGYYAMLVISIKEIKNYGERNNVHALSNEARQAILDLTEVASGVSPNVKFTASELYALQEQFQEAIILSDMNQSGIESLELDDKPDRLFDHISNKALLPIFSYFYQRTAK